MNADRLKFETSLRLLILLEVTDREISEEKAMCLDFICRTPSLFGIEGRLLEGINPMIFSQFLSSLPIFKKAAAELTARNLIKASCPKEGMILKLLDRGKTVAKKLKSQQAEDYRACMISVDSKFGYLSEDQLSDMINRKATENRYGE